MTTIDRVTIFAVSAATCILALVVAFVVEPRSRTAQDGLAAVNGKVDYIAHRLCALEEKTAGINNPEAVASEAAQATGAVLLPNANAPRERTAVVGTLDGVVGQGGGE